MNMYISWPIQIIFMEYTYSLIIHIHCNIYTYRRTDGQKATHTHTHTRFIFNHCMCKSRVTSTLIRTRIKIQPRAIRFVFVRHLYLTYYVILAARQYRRANRRRCRSGYSIRQWTGRYWVRISLPPQTLFSHTNIKQLIKNSNLLC